jgi:hypothetical protein
MTVDHTVLMDQLVSHAKKLGIFADVIPFEPKAAPTANGFTCALWFGPLSPLAEDSGLASTTAVQTVWMRLYLNAQDPDANTEPALMTAASAVLRELTANISFGLTDDGVWTDLLGHAISGGVTATPAYLRYAQGGTQFRVVEVRVPVVLEDFFPQGG